MANNLIYSWYILVLLAFWAIVFITSYLFILFFGGRINNFRIYLEVYLITIAFSILGLTLGVFVGLSTSPVVSVIIPALLSFLASFLVYIFIQRKEENIDFIKEFQSNRLTAALSLISFSLALMIGAESSATDRTQLENNLKTQEHVRALELKEMEYLLQIDLEAVKKGDTSLINKMGAYKEILERYMVKDTTEISFDEIKSVFENE